MKRNVVIKILLDIAMLVLYLMLMFARGFGGLFHEVVGIGIGVLFVIHILLNFTMTKGLIKSVKSGKAKADRVLLALSDLLLTVCMPIVIVTGVLIAKELFIMPFSIPWQLIFTVHNVLSYVCLGLMAFHVLFHGKYLIGVFKKLPTLSGREAAAALSRFAAGAAAAAVLYVGVVAYKERTEEVPPILDNSQNKISDTAPQYSVVAPSSSAVITEAMTNDDSYVITEKAEQVVTEDNETEVITQPQPTNPPSLEDYLSTLFCSGCHRHCSLISPRCGKGEQQAEQAKEEYVQMYGEG
ncbi:MAG: cytochrome b/b6 domain-containing protein [Acutalibacteraceae bacterium]